jgi:hypothetical protein
MTGGQALVGFAALLDVAGKIRSDYIRLQDEVKAGGSAPAKSSK